jgi:hypothetical protein
VSVGHVQRAIEATGIPTVSVNIEAFAHVPRQMSVARSLITPHPLGRPLGAPGDSERQLAVVEAALDLFDVAEPTIREFPLPYRPTPHRQLPG